MGVLSQHSLSYRLLHSLSQLIVADYSGRCHKKYHSNRTTEVFFTLGNEDTNCSPPLSGDYRSAVKLSTSWTRVLSQKVS